MIKNKKCGENASIGVNYEVRMIDVIYEVLSANVKWPAGLLLSDPRVAAGLWDAESIIFNRGRSVASWTLRR